MAHMDIFGNDAFRAIELSAAINLIPNQWGMIGQMGIFTPKPIRGVDFSVEMKNGVLQLIPSSTRGTPLPGQKRSKRKLKKFSTERFGLKSKITAADIANIRAFGSESELKQVLEEVGDRQEELRGSIDITREYLRSQALQGVVLDADGSVLWNLFDEFEVSQKSVDFTFGSSATDLGAKAREVNRHIQLNLRGDVKTGVQALMHPGYTDQLMGHDDFRERYKYYRNENGSDPLRDDTSKGFFFEGIYWKEYLAEADVPQEDGSTVTRSFVPDGEAMFFPLGTRTTFRDFNGSPEDIDLANMPGLPMYSEVFPDKQENKFVDVDVYMQTAPMCTRPGLLVRGHSTS